MKFLDQTGATELITLTKKALKPLESMKSSITDVNGIVKSDGSGGFSAATAGTDYAAASHTHDYLPLTGGAVTGAINYPNAESVYDTEGTVMGTNFLLLDNNGQIVRTSVSDTSLISELGGATKKHSHTKADITDFPTSMTPSAHKASHKTGGSDALAPADIGAADASHTHTKANITDFPSSMTPSAHKASHKTGGSDALTPADIGAAEASHNHNYLPITGGTLTGNLTGQYITGTWLQTTAAGDKAGNFATIDGDGWVYYRTPSEVVTDLDLPNNTSIRATTSVYGITRLSNSTTSSSKTLAATPYAVKTALDAAKAYTDAAGVGSLKIAVGSYTGTGTWGPDNPNSLTFDFAPKILMVFRTHTGTDKASGNLVRSDAYNCYFIQNLDLLTTNYVSGRGFGAQSYMGPFGKKSEDGKTISWYEDTNQAEYQLNKSGQTYSYVAFG